jgi:hypothetical protein
LNKSKSEAEGIYEGSVSKKETIFVGEPTIKNRLKISRAGEIQYEN